MIDLAKLTQTKELMEDGFDDFLQVFFSELESDIHTIQNTNDFALIALKAHSQKSSCALLGVISLSELFLQIEQLARDEQDVTEYVKQLPDLLTKTKQKLI
jgi:HPt (histidine-containing phosphotransfer) domain-containing protein